MTLTPLMAASVEDDTAVDSAVSPREEPPMVPADDDDVADPAAFASTAQRPSIFVRAASSFASRASRVIALPRARPKEKPIDETESEVATTSDDDRDTASATGVVESVPANQESAPVLPWQLLDEHGDPVDDAEVRQKILELTVFRTTYVDHPGGEEEYIFDHARYVDITKLLLVSDPSLREMHATLVPSAVDEAAFWRNFFLRCNAVRLSLARPPYLPEAKATYSTYSAVASLQKLKRELYLRRRSSTERIRRTILRPRNTSADLATDVLDVELGELDLDLDGEIDRELRKRRPSRAVGPGA